MLLVEQGTDFKYGARPLKRAVQSYLEDELSELLIEQSPSPESVVVVTAEEGAEKLTLELKDLNDLKAPNDLKETEPKEQ